MGLRVSTKTWHLILIEIVLFLTYYGSVRNGFVWDDKIFLVGNPVYKYFDLYKIFFSLANGLEYLPVRDLSYALDYALWWENSSWFHLTNLVIFALAAIPAYLCGCELARFCTAQPELYLEKDGERIALVATLLFVLHPIQSQVVNFITCRNALLCALFFFLGLYYFLRFTVQRTSAGSFYCYLFSLLFFLLALLSKATAISLPLVILLFIVIGRSRGKRVPFLSALPFFLFSAVAYFGFKSVALQTKVMRYDLPEFGIYSLSVRTAKALQIPFFYLGKLFLPVDFAAEYDQPLRTSLIDPVVAGCLTVLVLTAGFGWHFRGRYPLVVCGIGWFFIALVPVLNFFPTRPVVADRYAFLATFGIALVCSCAFVRLLSTKFNVAVLGAGSALLIFLGHGSAAQCAVWYTDQSLWEDTVKRSPSLYKCYSNLGAYHFSTGSYQRAMQFFALGQTLDPTQADLQYAQGSLAFNVKDYPRALDSFKKAIGINHWRRRSLYFAGIASQKLGDTRQAAYFYNQLFDSPEPDINDFGQKASLQLQMMVWPKLKPELEREKNAAQHNPVLLEQVADAFYSAGLYPDALAVYTGLQQQGYLTASLFTNCGAILERQGTSEQALDSYKKGLALHPENPQLLNRLGLLYVKLARYDQAIDCFRKGAIVDPSRWSSYNLAVTYFHLGDRDNAVRCLKQFDAAFPAEAFRSVPYWKQLRPAVVSQKSQVHP